MIARKAFSLLELIVVIGIILVLASIMFPAFSRAKQAAKETQSKGNLRQIYLGLMLYRENHGAKVEYGMAPEMGLPEMLASSAEQTWEVVRSRDVWKSPCCCHKDAPTGYPDYKKHQTDYAEYFHMREQWEAYAQKWQENSLLVVDMHCNDANSNLYAPRDGKIKLIGVRMNGSVESRLRQIGAGNFEWFWNP